MDHQSLKIGQILCDHAHVLLSQARFHIVLGTKLNCLEIETIFYLNLSWNLLTVMQSLSVNTIYMIYHAASPLSHVLYQVVFVAHFL